MGLAFQVPVQYCSLQHWILLSPPDTSTTDHHFCFGPAASFFLELLVIALRSFHGVAKDWTQLSNFHFHFPSSICQHLPSCVVVVDVAGDEAALLNGCCIQLGLG